MNVTLYSTGCPQCNVLKKMLSEKGISFEVNNDLQEMKNLGFKSAPMIKMDDQILNFKQAFKWLNEV